MDLEAEKRAEVRDALTASFEVWEEVSVQSSAGSLRVDLVALPKDASFSNIAIGFEVKSPKTAMNFQNWAKVFKQAADYVGATATDKRQPNIVLSSIFVFPSPPYVPETMKHMSEQDFTEYWYRKEQLLQYAGVIHLAQHFRVGYARRIKWSGEDVFHLAMGPNPIWNQKQGWFRDGTNLLSSVRVGSKVKKTK